VLVASWEVEVRRIVIQSQLEHTVHETLSQKYPTNKKKKTDGMAQVVEHLSSKYKALSSNSTTTKIKKET
jgi:primosomal protein N''